MRIARFMLLIALLAPPAVVVCAIEFTNTYSSLTTRDGRVYNNARPQRISDQNLVLFHSKGIATVRLADLPTDVQEQLRGGGSVINDPNDSSSISAQSAAASADKMLLDAEGVGFVRSPSSPLPLFAPAATNGPFIYSVANGEASITQFTPIYPGALVIPASLGG